MTETGPDDLDPMIASALDGLPSDFDGFGHIFQRDIRPALAAREADRVTAAAQAIRGRWEGGAVAAIGGALAFFAAQAPQLAILAAVAGFAYAVWRGSPLRQIGRDAKSLLVEPVARQLDLGFEEAPGEVASIMDHRRVGLVPSWDRDAYEDRVTGTRNGVNFELFEAHLEERRTTTDSKGRTRTRWVTVFNGQCLRFKFPKTFYGRTLVTRDAGFFNRFGGGKGMQRARLEDPHFEDLFEVYTTDQVESRYLLTPDLMQKLVDMEGTFRGGRLKCAFDGGEMFITVEGGNLFEPGTMFTPLDNPERVRELLDDFAAVFHVIDQVVEGREREDRERGA
jgi:hypothetical protein